MVAFARAMLQDFLLVDALTRWPLTSHRENLTDGQCWASDESVGSGAYQCRLACPLYAIETDEEGGWLRSSLMCFYMSFERSEDEWYAVL